MISANQSYSQDAAMMERIQRTKRIIYNPILDRRQWRRLALYRMLVSVLNLKKNHCYSNLPENDIFQDENQILLELFS